jgi:hypothetical protein
MARSGVNSSGATIMGRVKLHRNCDVGFDLCLTRFCERGFERHYSPGSRSTLDPWANHKHPCRFPFG